MGTKHDILTSREVEQHHLSWPIVELIESYQEKYSKKANEIKILDWGCGRGKSVIKLLEKGYQVKGVDNDKTVLTKGFDLLEKMNYDPGQVLIPLNEISFLPKAQFDIIYSEQVFEHIQDLEESIIKIAQFSKKEAWGIHLFPGALNIIEDHLKMPFIHWLPKKKIRNLALMLFLLFGYRPKPNWPGIEEMTLAEEAFSYYKYLDQKTYYRDIKGIIQTFKAFGFDLLQNQYIINPNINNNYFIRNGFPNRHMKIVLEKKI